MAKSGQEIADYYRSRMGQSTERIKDGILNTTKSQSGNAIAAKQLMMDNHRKAMEKGKWEDGLRKAGDEKWKRNAIEKGVGKITAGIDANMPEIVATFQKVSDVGEKVKNKVATMPKGSIDDAVNRVRTAITTQKTEWGKE